MDASSSGWYGNIPGLAGFNHTTNEFWGCGAPDFALEFHISNLELLCHIISARAWGDAWRGSRVLGHTDNEAS